MRLPFSNGCFYDADRTSMQTTIIMTSDGAEDFCRVQYTKRNDDARRTNNIIYYTVLDDVLFGSFPRRDDIIVVSWSCFNWDNRSNSTAHYHSRPGPRSPSAAAAASRLNREYARRAVALSSDTSRLEKFAGSFPGIKSLRSLEPRQRKIRTERR